jgi:tetratricopeptide (TPR) repeat protein
MGIAHREILGANAPAVPSALIELAEARRAIGDHEGGVRLIRRALDIRRKRLPHDHPDIGEAEVPLGRVLIAQGKAAEAEPLLQRALEYAQRPPFRLPIWQVGDAEAAFGWCTGALGRTSAAQALLRRAQAKLVNHPRPRHRLEASRYLQELRKRS